MEERQEGANAARCWTSERRGDSAISERPVRKLRERHGARMASTIQSERFERSGVGREEVKVDCAAVRRSCY